MLDYRVIGCRIRQYRLARGITQEELAFQINTSAAYVSNIERGIKKPSLQKLSDIAEAMHVTVNDFIYSSSDPEHDIQMVFSMYPSDKQKTITKNLADFIHAIIAE